MQTKFIIAAVAAIMAISAGAGLGVGWMWWGSGAGATEYADSDADERLGDARKDAVDHTDRAGDDLGNAVDAASRSGDEISDITGLIGGEYRELGNVSRDVADGIAGDAEIAGRIADIVRDGAHPVERGTIGTGDAAGPGAESAGPGGGPGGDTYDEQPP